MYYNIYRFYSMLDIFSYFLIAVLFKSIYVDANGVDGNHDFENYKVFYYRTTFTLECKANLPAQKGPIEIKWYKGEKLLTKTDRIDINNTTLTVKKPSVDEAGPYSCKFNEVGNPNKSDTVEFEVIMVPTAKLVETLTVVEGEKLRLECIVAGFPAPTVEWKIENNTYINSAGRIKLSDNEKGIHNAILEIDAATMDDVGNYYCKGNNLATRSPDKSFVSTEAEVYVRVKDKLAALWPFLGICAEVVILCTIIFIYEKKRNKTELEESDTDQSPEQDKK